MRDAASPGLLFVNHTSKMGGGEHILLSVLRRFGPDSALWMFQDGPLRLALPDGSVQPLLPRRPSGLAAIKRDKGLVAAAVPLAWSLASMTFAIAQAARRFRGVYANSQKAFVLSALAATLARRPLVWHLHDILVPEHFGQGQIRLLKHLAPRASRIIVPSAAAADALAALGVRTDRVRVVANGVTLDAEQMDAGERARIRRELGIPEDAFAFGVFSRLSPWKGQHLAIQALAQHPRMWCAMAGDALFGEAEYAASLPRLAAELGVADRVRFLGHRTDVPALMSAMDAVVHPSLSPEPFGRTLVEAMLCGTPVIAASNGAAPSILDGGTAGILVEPGNADAIATSLGTLAAGGEPIRRMIEVGRDRARREYSERAMQDNIVAVLQEIDLVA